MPYISIVDDSVVTRQCVATLLSRAGYEVSAAANGKEAFAALYGGVPDLIILDLMMPQMDGITFLRLLRAHHFWNDIPVVVLTGHADEEHLLDEARMLGVSDVIFKGDDAVEALSHRVEELLPLKSPQRLVAC
jgi:CheY-like chemotaxis protein